MRLLIPGGPGDDVPVMLWRRLDVPGHDACRLERRDFGNRLRGAAVYRHASGPASLSYCVDCDPKWRTISGRVEGFIGQRPVNHVVIRAAFSWILDGSPQPGLEHLADLDLGFTPSTNLLQLKRVAIAENERVPLPVA
jgi:hypothetical protein